MRYLESSDWTVGNGEVRDEEGYVFLPVKNGKTLDLPCLVDFEDHRTELPTRFFDYEFIYEARTFDDLSGGRFKTFRKNCRRMEGVIYRPITSNAALDLFGEWVEEREEVEDLWTIVRYLERASPWGLFVRDKLVGFNAWDSNWKFTNYRYAFTLGGSGA